MSGENKIDVLDANALQFYHAINNVDYKPIQNLITQMQILHDVAEKNYAREVQEKVIKNAKMLIDEYKDKYETVGASFREITNVWNSTVGYDIEQTIIECELGFKERTTNDERHQWNVYMDEIAEGFTFNIKKGDKGFAKIKKYNKDGDGDGDGNGEGEGEGEGEGKGEGEDPLNLIIAMEEIIEALESSIEELAEMKRIFKKYFDFTGSFCQ